MRPVQALRTEDPARIGDYTVLGRLGRGAMGVVYLARSPGGRLVAVKVVRPELADDPGFRDRFRQEVAAMRAVGGFWTAAVVDADPGGPWLATEYVPGPTLHDAVQAHGPLPVPALRALVAGLAEALRAIHGAGLVHRDLKPANVLLAADGPRVIDFGIAKALEGAGLTATGMFVGTPGFLSPEQIEGGDATPASDVFALGAVLVYAATGEGPFGAGDAAALMYRAVHAEPGLDRVPPELRGLARRCLDRTPSARPAPADLLTEVGALGQAEWLPDLVRAMIAEQETELGRPAPRPPTRPYTKALPFGPDPRVPRSGPASPPSRPSESPVAGSGNGVPPAAAAPADASAPGGAASRAAGPGSGAPPPTGSRAVFQVSRLSALVLGALTTAGAIACASVSQAAKVAGNGGGSLLFFVAFVLLAVPAVRLWWILVRPRHRLEVSAGGLTIGRGARHRQLTWAQLARVRVVEGGRRPWLVVWPHERRRRPGRRVRGWPPRVPGRPRAAQAGPRTGDPGAARRPRLVRPRGLRPEPLTLLAGEPSGSKGLCDVLRSTPWCGSRRRWRGRTGPRRARCHR